MKTTVSPRELVLDSTYQPRVSIDSDLVREYAEIMRGGWGDFPPVEVFRLENALYVVDGFHRVQAAREAKLPKIPANVRNGSADDALLFCVRANSTHGLRRSNEDKRRAVEMLLDHPSFSKLGKAKLADLAGVSKPMVLDVIRKRSGLLTTHEKRKVSTVDSTPPASVSAKLPPSVREMVEAMRGAGASAHVIESAVTAFMAKRQAKPKSTRTKRTTEERLKSLLEKVARERQKVAVVTLEEATPRTRSYAKLPRGW